jgi:hypothetical protein
MSMFDHPSGLREASLQRANQACLSCRKQKRKCNKALPACALCERMSRPCDYSDVTPPPTSEDFHALRMKLMELESRLNSGPDHAAFTPSSGSLSGPDAAANALSYTPPQDPPWQGVQNRFPAIAFLDSESFKYGGWV